MISIPSVVAGIGGSAVDVTPKIAKMYEQGMLAHIIFTTQR